MNARYRSALLGLSLIAGAWAPMTTAGDFGAGNVRVRLVADTDHIAPGGDFHLGVRFEIKPGWHIYWRYPGGAGLATEIKWQLPEGVQVGDLQWPLPIGFTQSEGIPGYGYEGTVVLASRVHVAPDFEPAFSTVGAEVSWLACKGVCVLGSARLEGKLAELMSGFDLPLRPESLPQELDSRDPPFSVRATGGIAEGHLSLWLRWLDPPPGPVEWFPDPPEALVVEDVRMQTRGGQTRIDAVVRETAGTELSSDILDSLVVITDDDGRRRGWTLAVGLTENES
jgi:hypothetical protein